MTTSTTAARPVSVDELKRAYHAVQAGTFRRHHRGTPSTAAWTPGSPVLAVVGASSGSGASTVALAVATAASLAGTARLLECASTTAAGLTAAATAELGRGGAGWVLGTRGSVRIERVADTLHGPQEVPTPAPGQRCDLLVVDVAWELGAVLTGHGWLTTLLDNDAGGPVVLTASATVPGLRRLETALDLLQPNRPVVALGGPSGRSHPREVRAALAVLARHHDLEGRVVDVPVDPRLRTCGVDSQPLPRSVLRAAQALLALTSLDSKDSTS